MLWEIIQKEDIGFYCHSTLTECALDLFELVPAGALNMSFGCDGFTNGR